MYLPLTLDEIRQIPLEDIFKTILSENREITIKMPDDAEVIIQPAQKLRPLPVFKGHMFGHGKRQFIINQNDYMEKRKEKL